MPTTKLLYYKHFFYIFTHIFGIQKNICFRILNLNEQCSNTFLSALYKFQIVLIVPFFFSFVHAPKCAYCISIICHVIQLFFYFMLAKDGCTAESIIVYMFILVIVIVFPSKKQKQKQKQKTNDPSFGLGKKLKSYVTIAHYLSFLLGKGGKPLYRKPY